MSTAEQIDPGRELINFWNEILVPKFLRFRNILVDGLAQHSAQIFPLLPSHEGDEVLDVGCGFGDTAIELARRVGLRGHVTGIDCCEVFLELARKDAATAGVSNVGFIEGDAQSHPFRPSYDFVISRFGTMFFENPVRALRNIRTAMKPDAQMTMIVWRTIEDNPFAYLPKQVVLQLLPRPGEDARTCGPGPFSMADQPTVAAMLQSAGFVDARFERVDAPILVGETVQDSMNFQLALGPAGETFREAGDVAAQRRKEVESALEDAISSYLTEEGIVMDSSSWVITARNPASPK